MYCAQCGAEYREGFTECNTCLIPLVESAARQPLPNDSQWSPTTRLGSKGTRLIFLYLAQVFVIGIGVAAQWWQIGTPRLDRKSTRLNSSHRCISYAVFCLKKKKKPRSNNNKRTS